MGETIRTFEYPNAKITVHIPELSEEERNRRMKQLERAAEGLLMELIKQERNINNDKITKSMER
jgi:ribosome recycling factor